MGSILVAVTSMSDTAAVSSKELLDIETTTECTLTLKRVGFMIRTHSQKLFLPLHPKLLNYFIYSRVLRHLRFYTVKQFQLRLAGGSKRFLFTWSERSFLSFKLLITDLQEKSCSLNWFTKLKKYFCLHLSQSEYQQVIVKRLTSSLG